MTEYLGVLLAARSGLWSSEELHDHLAMIAEWAHNQRGRSWRPLDDTTTAAPFLYFAPNRGSAWRRGVDFYDEGALLWLDVDTLIREKSGDRRSLDDFAKAFFGMRGTLRRGRARPDRHSKPGDDGALPHLHLRL